MKIIYAFGSFALKGGVERIFIDKANALAQAGHEIHLLCNFIDSNCSFAYEVDPRIQIHNISEHMNEKGGKLTLPFRWLSYRWRLNKAAKKILKKIDADILVMSNVWITSSLFKGAKRIVLESHGNREFNLFFSRSHLRSLAKAEEKADCIVALTEEDAALWHGKHPTIVIPNYTNIKPTDRQSFPFGRVCAVGRLQDQKDYDLMIDAWRIVADRFPQAALDIYGDGEDREKIRKHIEATGLQESIKLCGNKEDIASVYASHDFLVLSSHHEGMALVLIEAMTCGCPCVSVDCPSGPREVIADGEDGLLVEYRGLSRDEQVQRLADAICRMLADPAMCRRMGEAAARNVRRFDRATIMARWEQLFQSLLTTKN